MRGYDAARCEGVRQFKEASTAAPFDDSPNMTTKITVKNNGSIRIEGDDLELYDGAGNRYDLGGRKGLSLCRCGHSENKPFCDGKHKACGFQSEVVAVAMPPLPPKEG